MLLERTPEMPGSGSESNIKLEIWKVNDLLNCLSRKEIILPLYQRAQVWTMEQQRSLITSVQSDYPIGSFLFYKREKTIISDDSDQYELIDGLQRASTFRKYQKDPLKYFDFEELLKVKRSLSNALDSLYQELNEMDLLPELSNTAKDELVGLIKEWLASVNKEDDHEYASDALAAHLVHYYCTQTDINALKLITFDLFQRDSLRLFFKILDEIIDVGNYEFPVVVYSGDRKNLPDIFEKINTAGTKLDKYDILGAVWYSENNIAIDDYKITSAIHEKYYDITRTDIAVDGSDRIDQGYTLYEYLYGLGKVIVDEYDNRFLFKKPNGSSKNGVNPFIFIIACITFGLRLDLRSMSNLPKRIRETQGTPRSTPINLEGFKKAMLEAVEFVRITLSPYIGGNLFNYYNQAHTDLQMCSYICRVITAKYEVGNWNDVRPEWKHEKEILAKTLAKHYLYECLAGRWGNAGDSKAFDNVWITDSDGNRIPNNYYLQDYSYGEWDSALDQWFYKDTDVRQKKRTKPNEPSVTMLKYVYGNRVTIGDGAGLFDIDHIFPVKFLKSKISTSDHPNGWPMNAIGNLEFLPRGTNRSTKIDKTMARVIKDDPENKKLYEELKLFSMLDNPEEYGEDYIKDYDDYIKFLKMRNQIIKKRILSRLDISPES